MHLFKSRTAGNSVTDAVLTLFTCLLRAETRCDGPGLKACACDDGRYGGE